MAYEFKEIEESARKVWKKYNKEIRKATVKDDSSKKLFSFLEGPPTANAPPGLHHLEARTYKDLICKFKFMNKFSVPRKGGWDTHGLPVEVQVEKKLGLKSKKDVIAYGMDKFIKQCKISVFSNIKDWEESTKELDYWIDLQNAYKPLDNDYIESVWWSLKELYDKKLLYEGFKVVPYCPRCGTSLSSHEVSQGYKEIKEVSVYIAFKLKTKGEYILAWTTTPWTLPGNVSLAVGKDIDYVKVELPDGDKLIIGKDRMDVLQGDYKIVEEIKGKDLVGVEYEPLFDIKKLQNENSHKIILADFVTTEDGTGVVHTAGMYGEDDYVICKENNLPLIHTVNPDGKFNELVPKWKGKFVKSVEKEIIEDLKKRHLLFKTQTIQHTYPFCWRCHCPLLYYAIDSWFIAVTKVKDKMVKNNKKINWYPGHIKEGRFGKWLENIKDWNLSRTKFWGTPLPVWRCECGKEKIIGSVEELRKSSTKEFKKYDLHRPWIDKIKLKCGCGKEMSRIPDLIDVWYDSGSAPFAQFHYPFENKKEFEKRFPYDYISEAIDQTRGWFYTMHAISTMLFDKPAYKNVICAGLLVDEKGEKMSKTKGNIIKPREIIDKVGVDATRIQFCTTDPGKEKRFSENMVREAVLPFLNVLSNSYTYYKQLKNNKNNKKIEDKWILSRLNSVVKKVTKDLENYAIDKAALSIMDFVVNDFSRTYIKITRDREDTKEILEEVLRKVSLILAPYAPYISEHIYYQLNKKSVHLSHWPKINEKFIDQTLEKMFTSVLEIVEKGLAFRDKAQIGLKWPLMRATISCIDKISPELQEIIKTQLNVKELRIKKGKEIQVDLDTKMTPALESEGYARVIARNVQAARKKLGFVKTDRVKATLILDPEMAKIIENQANFIKERTNSKQLDLLTDTQDSVGKSQIFESKIKGKVVKIALKKL
ncbi:isoleucine--tRNA ligase [Candidatus Pacearchaeota archaeon]|nr:isoleucine--tRNA ligase [Candidatus Pacearchaeota archaeon]